MKYSVAALSMAAAAAAVPAFTNLDFNVVEGEPFTLEFTGCEGGCSIILKNGPEDDLQDVQQLTSDAEGGSFTFTLEAIPTDTYAFEIVNNETGENNYSQTFQYDGEAAAPSSSATSAEVTETVTTSVPETTSATPSTTEESSTETSTVAETTTVTSPSASTTASPTESTTASEDQTSTTDGAETTQTSEIPEAAAMGLSASMTFVVAAVAGLLMFN